MKLFRSTVLKSKEKTVVCVTFWAKGDSFHFSFFVKKPEFIFSPWKLASLSHKRKLWHWPVLRVVVSRGGGLWRGQRGHEAGHLGPHGLVQVLSRGVVLTRQDERRAEQARPRLPRRQEVHVHADLEGGEGGFRNIYGYFTLRHTSIFYGVLLSALNVMFSLTTGSAGWVGYQTGLELKSFSHMSDLPCIWLKSFDLCQFLYSQLKSILGHGQDWLCFATTKKLSIK